MRSFIQKGGRLSQPDICSIDVFLLLVQCWMDVPETRPTFESLSAKFAEFRRAPGSYLSIVGDEFAVSAPEVTSNVDGIPLRQYRSGESEIFPTDALPVSMAPRQSRDSLSRVFRSWFSRNRKNGNPNSYSDVHLSDLKANNDRKCMPRNCSLPWM
ncbi:Receptor tyrosine-protein kinase erbB-2 [Cichlidogyrus casuarinus]|uniref:Receptor tyrosine-protein kinase erbB-2 n=1 Tax=Cichlidogyrus casuarinus TaxID=1844966 RepID=A0ABD2PMT1_9PLAT